MSGFWSGTTATTPVTVAPPAGAAAGGEIIRIRAITASGTGILSVSDSSAGTIWQVTLPASGMFSQANLDIRGTVGGTLTIAVATGTGVSAQGDYVPIGYPYGLI